MEKKVEPENFDSGVTLKPDCYKFIYIKQPGDIQAENIVIERCNCRIRCQHNVIIAELAALQQLAFTAQHVVCVSVLAASMLLGLAGCGSNAENENTGDAEKNTAAQGFVEKKVEPENFDSGVTFCI